MAMPFLFLFADNLRKSWDEAIKRCFQVRGGDFTLTYMRG